MTQRNPELGLQSSELTQRNPELGLQSSELTQRNAELGLQSPELTQRNSELDLQSSVLAQRKNVVEHLLQATLGLALFWQDVGTSAVVHYLAFVPADVFQFGFCLYFQLLVINLAAVPGGRFSNSKTTPSPDRQTVKKLSFPQKQVV